jgi:hypothetical protein
LNIGHDNNPFPVMKPRIQIYIHNKVKNFTHFKGGFLIYWSYTEGK